MTANTEWWRDVMDEVERRTGVVVSGREARVLGAILSPTWRSPDSIISNLYAHPEDEPEDALGVVRTTVHGLRRKLRGHVEIETMREVGYRARWVGRRRYPGRRG